MPACAIDERQRPHRRTTGDEGHADAGAAIARAHQVPAPFRQRQVRVGQNVRRAEHTPQDERTAGRAASEREPLTEHRVAARASRRHAHEGARGRIQPEHARTHTAEQIEPGRGDAMRRLRDVRGPDELVAELLKGPRHCLRAPPLRDVAPGEHDAAHVGVLEQVGGEDVEPDPVAVRVAHAELESLDAPRGPQHPRERGAGRRKHGDDVGRRLRERTKQRRRHRTRKAA